MFERGERNKNPVIGKSWHSPLQALFGSRRGFANTGTHCAQFLAGLFRRIIDVFGDIRGPRSFWSHHFLPCRFHVLPSGEWLVTSEDGAVAEGAGTRQLQIQLFLKALEKCAAPPENDGAH